MHHDSLNQVRAIILPILTKSDLGEFPALNRIKPLEKTPNSCSKKPPDRRNTLYVFACQGVCEVQCGTVRVRAARSLCASAFRWQGDAECMIVSRTGAIMHSSPLTSRVSSFWLPCGFSQTRELPQGLATLWVEKRPLWGLQSPREPWREPLRHCPLCQVGCAASAAAFTIPPLSVMTGQDLARLPEAFTIPPLSMGQVDWAWDAVSRVSDSFWGRCPWSRWLLQPLYLNLLGVTSTDCATDLPTRPTTRKKPPQENQDQPQWQPEVQWSCSAVAVVLVCLVAAASLPYIEDFPHCRSITKICIFARYFCLLGLWPFQSSGWSPRCVELRLSKRQDFLKTLSPSLSRKENTSLEVA